MGEAHCLPQSALSEVPGRTRNGLPSGKPNSFPCRISTSSSPCRPPPGEIAFQNRAVIYAILFRCAAETLTTIAADPKHLGAQLGVTAVLHT